MYGNQIQSAVELDPAGSAQLFAALAAGTTPTASPTPTVAGSPTRSLAAGQVQVMVENATTTSGLAHLVADDLASLGFHIVATGNAAAGTDSLTVIRYPAGDLLVAQTLQAHIGGAQLQADNTLATSLVLVVGTNYGGVQSPNGSTPPPPSASTTLTPSPISAANLDCAP